MEHAAGEHNRIEAVSARDADHGVAHTSRDTGVKRARDFRRRAAGEPIADDRCEQRHEIELASGIRIGMCMTIAVAIRERIRRHIW